MSLVASYGLQEADYGTITSHRLFNWPGGPSRCGWEANQSWCSLLFKIVLKNALRIWLKLLNCFWYCLNVVIITETEWATISFFLLKKCTSTGIDFNCIDDIYWDKERQCLTRVSFNKFEQSKDIVYSFLLVKDHGFPLKACYTLPTFARTPFLPFDFL